MFKTFSTTKQKHNHYAVKEASKRKTQEGNKKSLPPSFNPRRYEIKPNNQAPFPSHNSSSSQTKPSSRETQVIILRLLLAADVADEVLPAGLLRSGSLSASFGMEECLRWDRGAGAEGLVVESVLVVEAGEEEDVSLKS